MITSLKIHNFKSLRNVELDNLPPFMVVVGANASGKSNFIKALDFLFEVLANGLQETVGKYRGYENICFRRARRSKTPIRFEFTLEAAESIYKYCFEFKAASQKIDAPYFIEKEELHIEQKSNKTKKNIIFSFLRQKNEIKEYTFNEKLLPGPDHSKVLLHPPAKDSLKPPIVSPQELWILKYFLPLLAPLINLNNNCFKTFRFWPGKAKEAVRDPSGAITSLGNQGEFLSSSINYFKKEKPELLANLLEHCRIAVPGIDEIAPRYTDESLLSFRMWESGFKRPWRPEDISDGTIQTLCLFIPLEDSRIRIAAFDEPENSIHPWIQEHFIDTCIEKSSEKQIILATHSIAAVDRIPPEAFYIIERDKGETKIRRALDDAPELKRIHDEKIMNVGEYWHSGALGGVPMQTRIHFAEDEESK